MKKTNRPTQEEIDAFLAVIRTLTDEQRTMLKEYIANVHREDD